MLLYELAVVVWALLPAFIPNNVAVVFGGGPPIDDGRTWRGRRLLGDGKTWRGLVVGTLWGAPLAIALNHFNVEFFQTSFPVFTIQTGLVLAFGAMLGDIGASFIKRRLDRERGSPVPGLDQLDFLVGAFVLVFLVDPAWVTTLPLDALLAVVICTPLAHLGMNRLAFHLGLKDEPW
jgi:CDP-2,3-bis-(O-geranylgeranyl)-sn-glycerol synthase